MTAGRFVLLHRVPNTIDQHDDVGLITSWDTWEEAQAAFPIDDADTFLLDQETGREWRHGDLVALDGEDNPDDLIDFAYRPFKVVP